MATKKEEFRIDLRGEYVDFFHKIKERNSIDTIVGVFRHCLEMTEQIEQGMIQSTDSIHPKLQYTVDHYLGRPDVQYNFSIKSENELLKAAVGNYITEIEEFVEQRSLTHWDVRSKLRGEEHKVAIAYMEIHLDTIDGSVSLNKLQEKLNWNDVQKLTEIMDEFVFKGLVRKERLGKHVLYHTE